MLESTFSAKDVNRTNKDAIAILDAMEAVPFSSDPLSSDAQTKTEHVDMLLSLVLNLKGVEEEDKLVDGINDVVDRIVLMPDEEFRIYHKLLKFKYYYYKSAFSEA